ncbi:tyrosine-type recombinase/integrase [Xylanimonas protaetiae]|uniref:Site-specific integrase n=1 Tax=Xylanimonas protaetiae TaxID=2509457 RepID=A0A4P6F029_9MICO|nr:tyrosine-type recombinase/integrase [Xylanimonas protaetiae]QAY68802.1 site-specific integrase [Xylanimonas protaetiae]
MSTARETWGSLRKLPSGRWQARYPGPDGRTYPARTEDDQALTFQTKSDARGWLARVQVTIADGRWEPPAAAAARRRAERAAEAARNVGFRAYAEQWIDMVRTTPSRSGKMRSAGTVRSYRSKITGYLIPEFGDIPVREIDIVRIRQMVSRLDTIPAEVNRKAEHNGITRPVLVVLMMILRQAVRDGTIPAAPAVSIPRQKSVRHGADHDPSDDVIDPWKVEEIYEATPPEWRILVLLAAWCQLRRGEALGLQRRDIVWHDDGTATLNVRRQLNANTGDYTDPKTDAGKRAMSVPKIMRDRLAAHLSAYVAPEAKAPVVPSRAFGKLPLSNTKWGYIWAESRDSVLDLPTGFRFHDLRHTGLTIFAQEGATLAELMRRGGHSDIRVVLRYQHATMERDRELAERMSDRALVKIAAAKEAAAKEAAGQS